jgi:hypothetical protein
MGRRGGEDPGAGKTNNNGFRRISVLFFSFLVFDIEILAKFNPKKKRAKLVEFTLEKKNKIFENVPNFFVEK